MGKLGFPDKKWVYLIICALAALSGVIFVILGLKQVGLGFPLDDAWIHQTYARNLMLSGTWSFIPGVISGGSTSPLWTMMLAPGYLLPGSFFFYWTLIITISCLVFLVYFVCKTFQVQQPDQKIGRVILLGLIVATEWHLVWAAASGMETILFSLIIVILIYLSLKENINWWLTGILTGLLVWIRPDGLTILGPMAFVILQAIIIDKSTWKKIYQFILPVSIFIVGYLLFNYATTGQLFPNTFYAKQMEYQVLLVQPVWQRIVNEFSPIFVGVGTFLLPGFLYEFYATIKTKNIRSLGFILWVIGYVLIFTIRLPVIYQHGRYVIPVIAIFLLTGFTGTIRAINKIKNIPIKKRVDFVVSSILIAVSLGFYIIGVGAYRTDLLEIDTFMVQPAKWVAENTDSSAVIAVHDIGAMGFYSNRKIIDLAGLVNPEVIPFIRDENKILTYMKSKNAQYFVGFSDWYKNSSQWGDIIKSYTIENLVENKNVVIIKLSH